MISPMDHIPPCIAAYSRHDETMVKRICGTMRQFLFLNVIEFPVDVPEWEL